MRERVSVPAVIVVVDNDVEAALRTLRYAFVEVAAAERRHREALPPGARRRLKSFKARRRLRRQEREAQRRGERRRRREALALATWRRADPRPSET